MVNSTRERAVWSLQNNIADLRCGALSGRIDVTRPHLGLHQAATSRHDAQTFWMGVSSADAGAKLPWPAPLAEAYLRGDDLVAAYRQTDNWPFAPQLYWQANLLRGVDGVLASASLLVSLQTSLLDTFSQISVTSQFSRGELFLVSTAAGQNPQVEAIERERRMSPDGGTYCVVSRDPEHPRSYIEIVTGEDFHDATLKFDDRGNVVEWRLFADFLEKGVIRRARVHSAVLPRENDIECAVACCEASERLQLPLTT